MSAIVTVSFPDWESFRRDYRHTLFGAEKADKSRYLFRGQSDSEWRLESSFDRWFSGTGRPAPDRANVARKLLDGFARELMNSAEHKETQNLSDEEVMALGQHYGLPTRLLDWSRSLYIAAYFAFSDSLFMERKSRFVAIWALNAVSPVWTGEFGARIINLPAKSNARLRNQESCFTLLSSLSSSLEDFVDGVASVASEPLLYQLVIPASCAKEAVDDLDFIGFSARRLFPDFEGYARSAFAAIATR